jgi:hypothetical protein
LKGKGSDLKYRYLRISQRYWSQGIKEGRKGFGSYGREEVVQLDEEGLWVQGAEITEFLRKDPAAVRILWVKSQ